LGDVLDLLSEFASLPDKVDHPLYKIHLLRKVSMFLSLTRVMSLTDIVLMCLTEIVGDFGFKGVARHPTPLNWATGIGGYIGIIYYLIKSLRVGNVTYVNGMWDGISGILETLVAYFLFGERLNTRVQYVGIFMIAFGLMALKGGGIAH